MLAKIIDNQIVKYPYYHFDLVKENPNTSFPANMTNELYALFDIYPVKEVSPPSIDYTKNLTEESPNFIDGDWVQDWTVSDASPEEIAQRVASINAEANYNRAEAYKTESDPLFFKWQRGESTQEMWIAKVNEIKARYPDIV